MGKLSDVQIRGWIKAGERFGQHGGGEGLFRYWLAGQLWHVEAGRCPQDGKGNARCASVWPWALITAGEKKKRKREAVHKIETDRLMVTLGQLYCYSPAGVKDWYNANSLR
ncbi:MAG: hypothetical protein HY853_05430 [Burkholderiales bacterium]|nr:hypothetical protein [Burkholderiales bacterium]